MNLAEVFFAANVRPAISSMLKRPATASDNACCSKNLPDTGWFWVENALVLEVSSSVRDGFFSVIRRNAQCPVTSMLALWWRMCCFVFVVGVSDESWSKLPFGCRSRQRVGLCHDTFRADNVGKSARDCHVAKALAVTV